MKVNSDFSGDWMKEFDGLIPPMLEDGVDVLIYGESSVRSDGLAVVSPVFFFPSRNKSGAFFRFAGTESLDSFCF